MLLYTSLMSDNKLDPELVLQYVIMKMEKLSI